MRTLEEIREEVMGLSDEERMALADMLSDSLLTAEQRTIQEAWLDVAEERLAEIEAGTAELISGDDALRDARAAVDDVRKAASRR